MWLNEEAHFHGACALRLDGLRQMFTFSEPQLPHLWNASLTGCREDQGLHSQHGPGKSR